VSVIEISLNVLMTTYESSNGAIANATVIVIVGGYVLGCCCRHVGHHYGDDAVHCHCDSFGAAQTGSHCDGGSDCVSSADAPCVQLHGEPHVQAGVPLLFAAAQPASGAV
jgi:hypothetical protein